MKNPIDELDKMLTDASIPHVKKQHKYSEIGINHSNWFTDQSEGPKASYMENQICYPDTYQSKEGCQFDCIWQFGSYGTGQQVESYGPLGSNEHREPRIMTIDDAFKIISEDWTKNHPGVTLLNGEVLKED